MNINSTNKNSVNSINSINSQTCKKCENCNYYIKHNQLEYCQLFPTFEHIHMYTKPEDINKIPHEYYKCDIARSNVNMCNGNNFSKSLKT